MRKLPKNSDLYFARSSAWLAKRSRSASSLSFSASSLWRSASSSFKRRRCSEAARAKAALSRLPRFCSCAWLSTSFSSEISNKSLTFANCCRNAVTCWFNAAAWRSAFKSCASLFCNSCDLSSKVCWACCSKISCCARASSCPASS